MSVEVVKQGAEARLYIGDYKGEKCLVKERFIKQYRHPDLDTQLTKQRMKAESRNVERCLKVGILAPRILNMDLNERRIYMEYFCDAITVKEYLLRTAGEQSNDDSPFLTICRRIGQIIGKMHSNNIVHGDLTTSNILVNPTKGDLQHPNELKEYDIVFIDFGLSQYSESVEHKGVDLYVLERALLSAHSELPDLFQYMLDAYRKECRDEQAVINKFEEVRARGRKRTMVG